MFARANRPGWAQLPRAEAFTGGLALRPPFPNAAPGWPKIGSVTL